MPTQARSLTRSTLFPTPASRGLRPRRRGGSIHNQVSELGGYYLLGSDGGVFSFGDAQFHGSTGGILLNQPVVAMSRTGSSAISITAEPGGYRIADTRGRIFEFGAIYDFGDLVGIDVVPARPIIGLS